MRDETKSHTDLHDDPSSVGQAQQTARENAVVAEGATDSATLNCNEIAITESVIRHMEKNTESTHAMNN
jgi:hypothetical protein